jgi:RNA polymerase sigma-70 factor (ECF subfamily)
MMIPSTHASLLHALQTDEHREDAWAAFEARYRDAILGWCLRRGVPLDCAEDLAQEVLLRLFQDLPNYNSAKGAFRSWLKAVVSNALTDCWRRQRRRPEQGGVGGTAFQELLAGLETPETVDELSGVIEAREKSFLANAFALVQGRVEPKTWQSFYQREVLQRPAAEVAAELGLTVGAVYKYTCRVKEMVRQEYIHVRRTR